MKKVDRLVTSCVDCPFVIREQGGVLSCGHDDLDLDEEYGEYSIINKTNIPPQCPINEEEVYIRIHT